MVVTFGGRGTRQFTFSVEQSIITRSKTITHLEVILNGNRTMLEHIKYKKEKALN